MKYLLLILSVVLMSMNANAWVLEKGNLDKTDFDYDMSVKGRVSVLFYVNPSKKNLNNEASEAIKTEAFDSKYYASMGIIDMKSSWLPNGIITSSLKKKQKKYPRTIYLRDLKKSMHEILDFKPKGNDIFVFNDKGEEIYRHLGKLDASEIQKVVAILKAEVTKLKSK